MKRSLLHIASSIFLVSSLLFTQLAVNFFHQNHDVHEVKASFAEKNTAPEWHKHDEHCKVCAIDFFNHAVDFQLAYSFFESPRITPQGYFLISFFSTATPFHQGRAPPVV